MPAAIRRLIAALAQLVEHLIRHEGVGGSNPSSGTIPLFADVQISLEKADSGVLLPESGTFNVTRVRRGTLIPVLFVALSVGRANAARATGQHLLLIDVALRSAKPTDSIQKLSDGGGLQGRVPFMV